jgi:hypothetical protein
MFINSKANNDTHIGKLRESPEFMSRLREISPQYIRALKCLQAGHFISHETVYEKFLVAFS